MRDLTQKLKLDQRELFAVYEELAYKKDGNIIAQTYNLPLGMSPRELLSYLFVFTENEYEKYSMKIFGKYDRKEWYRYVTIASIIQKESGSKEEMAQVSGVIYNRISKRMRLQMDGALNYGAYSHTKVTPAMIENDTTSYNTYKNYGIPNDPICAVEFEAIRAALFPVKSNYLYFMKKPNGKGHNFSSSFDGHRDNIIKVKESKRVTQRNN